MRVACLHTAESNAAVFEAARLDLGLAAGTLRHEVRPDLLAEAERAGGPTPRVETRTGEALLALCDGADAVVLTCSTLGPAVRTVADAAPVPVLRADAALAEEVVRGGGKVVVLCAVETTLGPTLTLFEVAARATGATVEVRLVPGAWAAFKAGEHDRHLAMVAPRDALRRPAPSGTDRCAMAADEAARGGASRVALAQASMAGAAGLGTTAPPPLASPAAALLAAAAAAVAKRAAAGER